MLAMVGYLIQPKLHLLMCGLVKYCLFSNFDILEGLFCWIFNVGLVSISFSNVLL